MKKKRHNACMIKGSGRTPGSFPAVLARLCRIKMPACTVSFSSTSKSPHRSSPISLTAVVTNPAFSTFTYLFHSARGVVPLEAYCMVLGDNRNTSPFPAAGGVKRVSCSTLVAAYSCVTHQLDFISISYRCVQTLHNRKTSKRILGCSSSISSKRTCILCRNDPREWASQNSPPKCPG